MLALGTRDNAATHRSDLCVDWVPPHGPWDDTLVFVFDGGALHPEQSDAIKVSDQELEAFRFCTEEEASVLHRRLVTFRHGVRTVVQQIGCALCRSGRRFGWMVATSEIEYEADGGVVMIGHLAVPEDDAGVALPAVLVAHEAPGLDDVHRERADRLAERGYVAFALDAHGAGRFRLDDPRIRERVAAISNDPDRARSIAASALEILRGNPRVDASRMAAIGYCFGGTLVLELARGGADLRAVVGFHPGLGTSRPEDARSITGTVLVCVGSEDPYVDGDARAAFEAEMRAGGVDWRMHLYGGVQHSFTHPHADRAGIPGLAYDPAAADRAWRAMLDLFEEVIGPEGAVGDDDPAPSLAR